MKILSYNEIQSLIKNDEIMQRAYKKFREAHPRNKIIDMYYMLHINLPIDEICIKYLNQYDCIRNFEYKESYKG